LTFDDALIVTPCSPDVHALAAFICTSPLLPASRLSSLTPARAPTLLPAQPGAFSDSLPLMPTIPAILVMHKQPPWLPTELFEMCCAPVGERASCEGSAPHARAALDLRQL